MQDLVEKKLAKLKLVDAKYCKPEVKDALDKVEPKKFKDLNQLTDWFIKTISKQEPRFREMFQKYEAEQALWVEAYKYIRPSESPDYIVMHDLLLDIYDKVDFYIKDANKDPELGKSIIFRLVIATATKPDLRNLIKIVDQKKNQLVQRIEHKNEAPKPQPSPPAQTSAPKPPPPSSSQAPKPKSQPKPVPPKDPEPSHPPQAPAPKQKLPPPTSIPSTSTHTPNPPQRIKQPPPQPQSSHVPHPPSHQTHPHPPPPSAPVRQDVSRPVMTKHIKQMKTHDQHKAISGLLNQRRDLEFADVDSKKEVIGFLVVQLNTYMKNFLQKIIRLAKIHNTSHNRYGDEFKYFSKPNELRLDFNLPIQLKVRHNFYKIRFPDKLSIYSNLRNSEQVEENKLRVEDTKKRKQNEKEIIEYVRGEHKAPHASLFKEENNVPDKLMIKLLMVQTLLETDPVYMDSELLRRSYLVI